MKGREGGFYARGWYFLFLRRLKLADLSWLGVIQRMQGGALFFCLFPFPFLFC